MKIPKTLKVGNLQIKVGTLKESESTHYGKCSVAEQGLWLSARFVSEDKKNETFFHEIIHLILDEGGYTKESENEQLVNHISQHLYQVLKDNKLLK